MYAIRSYYDNFGLQSSWELDTWGRLRNQKKAAAANYLSSNEGHHFATTNLVASIATNYYQLLSLDKQLSIIDNSIMLQDSALTIVLIQKQAGRANILGVKQFEAQILNSKKLRIETLQSIEQCENNLNLLLGRFPQPIRRQENAFKADTTQLLNHGIPSYLLENRPDIRQAEFEVIAANANLKSAKASFLPTRITSYNVCYTKLLRLSSKTPKVVYFQKTTTNRNHHTQ